MLITSDTVAVCCSVAPVPVTVSGNVASATEAPVLTVSVEDCGEASTISTVVGAKTALEFAGNPLMPKSMLPLKPPDGVTVTVYVALPSGMIVREDGSPLTTNCGEPLPLAIRATNASLGPPPNTACKGFAVGQSAELVSPVIQASAEESTLMPSPASSLAPPR